MLPVYSFQDTSVLFLFLASILTFPTSVSNGLWHHIEWHQMGGDMTVDLNGMSLTHPHLVDLFSIDQKSMITVLIGAKPFDRGTKFMLKKYVIHSGFMNLHMDLVVLMKKMSVFINFLMQNTKLVSVLSKIYPNFADHV